MCGWAGWRRLWSIYKPRLEQNFIQAPSHLLSLQTKGWGQGGGGAGGGSPSTLSLLKKNWAFCLRHDLLHHETAKIYSKQKEETPLCLSLHRSPPSFFSHHSFRENSHQCFHFFIHHPSLISGIFCLEWRRWFDQYSSFPAVLCLLLFLSFVLVREAKHLKQRLNHQRLQKQKRLFTLWIFSDFLSDCYWICKSSEKQINGLKLSNGGNIHLLGTIFSGGLIYVGWSSEPLWGSRMIQNKLHGLNTSGNIFVFGNDIVSIHRSFAGSK